MKLAELKMIRNRSGEEGIFLMDDIFSELDRRYTSKILNYLDFKVQTFITCTELDKISGKYAKNSNILKINNGKIVGSLV